MKKEAGGNVIMGRSGRQYDSREFLSTKELADALGRSESYIYAMKSAGFKMVGRRQTFKEVLDFLEGNPNFSTTSYFKGED